MTWWEGLILGVVQGLTEFLPVSSSGHLVIAQAMLGISPPGITVEVVVHAATLAAVVIVYWRRLVEITAGMFRADRPAWRTIGLLVLATIPAGVIGVAFKSTFEALFQSLTAVGINLLVTGTLLWSGRWAMKRGERREPGAAGAVAIGLAQAFAILPGISRSGSTIIAGMWLKLDAVRAAEFSFLMAIPAIAGASVLELRTISTDAVEVGAVALAVSFVAALIAGVFAIRFLVHLLARQAFHRFAPYCWSVGVITLFWVFLGK